jgi:choline-sulfatase
MQKPNILMIMVDQLAAQALPFYGHKVVKVPHLSKLASESVVFDHAYCNSPLCAPSRFSMMSGQLPSSIGAYDNAAYFPADVPTLAHYLRSLGYQTSLCGKMHFVGPDQLHGFEERLTTDIYPSDFGWVPDWEDFQTRPSWYHNMLSVVQAGKCESSNQLDFDEEVGFKAVRKLHDLARTEDERPFFLLTSFTHPHDPFAMTSEYWDRYAHDDIDMPEVKQLSFAELDAHSQRLHHVSAMSDYEQTEARVRNARHAYYAMISYIDDKVGALLKTLELTWQRENTVILFVSDHGEMLGERGMWYKMSFFERSARIPMLMHVPGLRAQRIEQPVSLLDILPTLTDIASDGLFRDYVVPISGSSLFKILRNELPHRPVYGEMLAEGAIAPLLMIRQGNFKYIYSKPDPEQLFDLNTDPNELNNLAAQPAYTETLNKFRQMLNKQWDNDALHKDVLASQRKRRLIDIALRQGKHTPWDFQPFQDASSRFMRNHLDLNVLERTSRFPNPEQVEPER